MWDFIFSSLWGWIGVAGLIVLVCLAIAWLIPPLRPYAVAVAIVAVSVATAFTKGWNARAARENERKEEAVRKAQKDYAKIDARPDTDRDALKRLRDGSY
jgi:hypothetical protein